MESAFVPIFLQEFLASLRLLLSQFLSAFHIFLQTLILWKSTTTLNLFTLLLPLQLGLLLFLDPCKFPEPPRLEFAFRIQSIGVVDIKDILLLLLCMV